MSTLTDYWTGEAARWTGALAGIRLDLAAARTAQSEAQTEGRLAADALRAARDAVDKARQALAGIPMPADGDPLLLAMTGALVGWRQAQQRVALADLATQRAKAEAQRLQDQEAAAAAELAEALASRDRESAAHLLRLAALEALSTTVWADVTTQAGDALDSFEADARSRVEGEFPTHADDAKSLLARVRARRGIVARSVELAQDVRTAAFTASQDGVAEARRRFDLAWQAVRAVLDAPARLADDRDTLARLAALPEADPPQRYPIVTPAQHGALFDDDLKADREAALAKLKAADDAHEACRQAQADYDKALHAAMKAHPDKTLAELNADDVSGELATLSAKAAARTAKREALDNDAPALATLQAWFAAVPEPLWEALDQLDAASTRLQALKDLPSADDLKTALADRETELVDALTAARQAWQAHQAAGQALRSAQGALNAEQDTALRRARAAVRSTAQFEGQ